MNFNLNYDQKPEYDLNSSMIKEVINMYGVRVKMLLQERVNNDQIVFGDRSHLFTDQENQFDMYQLPENPDSFEERDYGFSQFGLEDMNSINFFIHQDSLVDLPGVEPINTSSREYTRKMKPTSFDMDYHLVGHLLILPSGKILEITDQQHDVPGINNIFVSKNMKSVYKVTCVSYQPKIADELDDVNYLGDLEDIRPDDSMNYVPEKTLEDYFDELEEHALDREYEAEINDTETQLQNLLDRDQDTLPCTKEEVHTQLVDDTEKAPWEL